MRNSTLPKRGNFQAEKYLTIIILCILLSGASNLSFAQITSGFELDGNATSVAPNPPDDWDLINSGTSHAQVTSGIVSDAPSDNDNAFVIGSKDQDDIPDWHWQDFSTPDKDDILHGGAALYNGDQVYFFGDRYATNGDAQIGFWFFKNKVTMLPNGTFSGTHAVGDILLLSDFVNGGGVSVISAYEWVGSGGDFGSLQSVPVNGSKLYAITNASSTNSPWPYDPKSGPSNIFGAGAFYEGGIDLAGLGFDIDPCFTSFMLETRSSASITAELKDFILGNFFVKPQVTVSVSNQICIGGSATLSAVVVGGDAPFIYSWSTGAVTSSITVSPTVTTTYTVFVNTANGCSSLPATGTVVVNPLPACSIGDISPSGLICNHGNYTIAATSIGKSYLWSISVDGNPSGWAIVGSNTGSSVTFSSGNCGPPGFQLHVSLTITDANGCVSNCSRDFGPGAPSCNVTIRQPVVLTCAVSSQYLLASYSTDIINPDFDWTRNSVSIGAGINDYNGLDSILISLPGTYRFTIVDPANSSNTCFGEVNVSQDTAHPGASASGGSLNCVVTSLNILASSLTAGVNFSWNGPGGFTSSQQNPNVSAPGTYTVVVTKPGNGCTSTAQAIVTQNIVHPTVSAMGGVLTCTVTSVQLTSTSSAASSDFSWSGPGAFTSSQQNPTVTASGTYTVTITDTDNGCTSTAQAVVSQNNAPPPCNISDVTPGNVICNHGNYSVSTTLDAALYTFLWSISVDGNPSGWGIVGSNTGTSLTFSAGNCGSAGFLVHISLTVTGKTSGCAYTCSRTFAPGAPACNVSIRPLATLNCTVLSEYLLASYSTDISNPIFQIRRNGVLLGSGINDNISLDSILISLAGTYTFTIHDPNNSANDCSDFVIVAQNSTPVSCLVCNGNSIIVDQNVTVDFNTNPPTYTGDPDLHPFFTYDNTNANKNLWNAIFDLRAYKLVIKNGATITTTLVGGFAPGIIITGTCEMQEESGGHIVVNSSNNNAGNILIQFHGNALVNGEIRNQISGTIGLPGSITVSSICGNISVGGLVQILGSDFGSNVISLVTCGENQDCFGNPIPGATDITVSGLVKAFGHGHGKDLTKDRPVIRVVSFTGSVIINAYTAEPLYDEFQESGTRYDIYGGLLSWTRDNVNPGAVYVQALNDIIVNGHGIDPTGPVRESFGAIAAIATASDAPGGLVDVRSLAGSIFGYNRAFDVSGRNRLATNFAHIRLWAKQNISINRPGADNTFNPVVDASSPTIGDKGGTNELRAYSGGITVGANALVSAAVPPGSGSVQGVNLLTSCTGVIKTGSVVPSDLVPADDINTCNPVAPTALYDNCASIAGSVQRLAANGSVNTPEEGFVFYPNPTSGDATIEFRTSADSKYSILIFDVAGRVVMNKIAEAKEGVNSYPVSLHNVAKGMYMVVLETVFSKYYKRIVIE